MGCISLFEQPRPFLETKGVWEQCSFFSNGAVLLCVKKRSLDFLLGKRMKQSLIIWIICQSTFLMEEHISGEGYLQKKRGSGLWESGHKMLPWLNALHFIIKYCLIICSYCIRGSASAFHIYSSVAAISPFSLRSVVKCSCTPLLSTAGISFQNKNILGFSTGFKGYWTWTPEGRLSLKRSFAHASQESDKIPLHRI